MTFTRVEGWQTGHLPRIELFFEKSAYSPIGTAFIAIF